MILYSPVVHIVDMMRDRSKRCVAFSSFRLWMWLDINWVMLPKWYDTVYNSVQYLMERIHPLFMHIVSGVDGISGIFWTLKMRIIPTAQLTINSHSNFGCWYTGSPVCVRFPILYVWSPAKFVGDAGFDMFDADVLSPSGRRSCQVQTSTNSTTNAHCCWSRERRAGVLNQKSEKTERRTQRGKGKE